jgi:hypothetical protein
MATSYFIEVPEGSRQYVDRDSWEGRVNLTEDPERAVIMGEVESHGYAARIGLPRAAYSLVDARPIRVAHRQALREKRAKAQRVAESLATALRARFHGLDVYVGGSTRRDVRVWMVGLEIAEFYVDMDAKIGQVGSERTAGGGIENAIWALGERLAQIRAAVDGAAP